MTTVREEFVVTRDGLKATVTVDVGVDVSSPPYEASALKRAEFADDIRQCVEGLIENNG